MPKKTCVKRMIKAMNKQPIQTLLMSIIILVFILVIVQLLRRDPQVEKLDWLKNLFGFGEETNNSNSSSTVNDSTANSTFSTPGDLEEPSTTKEPSTTACGFTVTREMDTGGTELQRFESTSNLFSRLHSVQVDKWPLADCKSACEDEQTCGGFTFADNNNDDEEGVCYFKKKDDNGIVISLADLPDSVLHKANLYSAYLKTC